MWYVILFAGVVIFSAILTIVVREKEAKERAEKNSNCLNALEDFTVSRKIIGFENRYILASDNERRKVVFIREGAPVVFRFEDIISVEKIEDGETVLKKSAPSTVGGAIVGSVLAGGVGAVIGGLSSKSNQKRTHTSTVVKVLLRNSTTTTLVIDCFNYRTMTTDQKPVSHESYVMSNWSKNADAITDLLNVIIDSVDQQQNPNKESENLRISVVDEITKLAGLKESGILTEEEFNKMKSRIIENGVSTSTSEASEQPSLPTGDPLDEKLRELKYTGQPLAAVKMYRNERHCSLEEAKYYVDNL